MNNFYISLHKNIPEKLVMTLGKVPAPQQSKEDADFKAYIDRPLNKKNSREKWVVVEPFRN